MASLRCLSVKHLCGFMFDFVMNFVLSGLYLSFSVMIVLSSRCSSMRVVSVSVWGMTVLGSLSDKSPIMFCGRDGRQSFATLFASASEFT